MKTLLARGRGGRISAATTMSFLLACAPLLGYDWPQMNGDPQHSGNNTLETKIGTANVAGLGFFFQVTLPSVADGAPVFLSGVPTSSGPRDVLFATTRAGHLLAIDARSGATIWSKQYPAGSCHINGGSTPCYTTSSPAIDPNRQNVYAYGLDGYVHKVRAADGFEVVGGGWPELTTLKGQEEKGSSAVSFATAGNGATYLYMTHGGYPGDNGDYQGHVTAINLADGSQKVFNAVCSDQTVHFVHSPGSPDCPSVQTAMWARVGIVYDDVTNRIYVGTGNGIYTGNMANGHEWSESLLSLAPDAAGSGGKPLDSYTPVEFQTLDNQDNDLGSTSPALLPAPGFSGRLAAQSGKDQMIRLVDLTNMSSQGGPGHLDGQLQKIPVPQGNRVLSAPAVWVNPADGATWLFLATGSGISGLKLTVTAGVPSLAPVWQKTPGGFSPLVANNILYYATSGSLRALNPLTGGLLWSDATHVGSIHWESPIVANGVLYLMDESAHLTAWALGPALAGVDPPAGPSGGGTGVTIAGDNFVTGATVSFGGNVATGVKVVDPQTILATAPPHAPGLVGVTVTNPDARNAMLASSFDYYTVTPAAGPADLIPDGRSTSLLLPPGGAVYQSRLLAGRSYSIEADASSVAAGAGGANPSISVTRADGMALSAGAADRSGSAAASGARAVVQPSAADAAAGPIRIVLSDPSSSGYPIRIRAAETTLACARWSVNAYAATIGVQNSGDALVSGQIVLFDSAGATLTTLPFSLLPGSAAQIGIPGGLGALFGSARLTHDGPPGAVTAGIAMTSGSSAGTNFRWPFVETRASGATDGR